MIFMVIGLCSILMLCFREIVGSIGVEGKNWELWKWLLMQKMPFEFQTNVENTAISNSGALPVLFPSPPSENSMTQSGYSTDMLTIN